MEATETPNPSIVFTDDQQNAINYVVDWANNKSGKKSTSVGGYAGTGKTTVIRELLQRVTVPTSVCAFTGKAGAVLRSKGVWGACTMHSLMYYPRRDEETGRMSFVRRDFLETPLVIVDEASMVNRTLYDDLVSFDCRVLWVGDMGQLEPIGDNPNLMADPDVKLTHIHRQAAESDIIQFSVSLRSGKNPRLFSPTGSRQVQLGHYDDFLDSLLDVDQVLCGFNRTRITVNSLVREHHERRGLLVVGDKVICLQNNKNVGVFNGMMGRVTKINRINTFEIDAHVQLDDGRVIQVSMDPSTFGTEKREYKRPSHLHQTFWDYGYAITVHKSQGSEWKSVAVMEELHPDWDAKRWRYTAATRAAERLIYCT